MKQLRAMNLGCGDVLPEGWTNVDSNPGTSVADHELWDFTSNPNPAWLGQFDLVVMNHSLQQVEHAQVIDALRNVRELLVDGGCLRVLVPHVLAAFHAYENGYSHHFQVADEHETTLDSKFCAYLSQAGTANSFFTPDRLYGALLLAGFDRVGLPLCGQTLCEHKEIVELDSRCEESLIGEGFR